MNAIASSTTLASSLKALWLLLTAGAFASFMGWAPILIYFWTIGGVPVWQAAAIGSFTGIVYPTTMPFLALLLFIWFSPSIAYWLFASGGKTSRPLFEHVFLNRGEDPTVNRTAIAWFSVLTVGMVCLSLSILLVQAAGQDSGTAATGPSESYWPLAPLVAMLVGLMLVYLRSDFRPPVLGLLLWLGFGVISGVMAISPLILFVSLLLKGDYLLESPTPSNMALGMALISTGLVIAFGCSVWITVQRALSQPIPWRPLLAGNLLLMASIVIGLGMSQRILERIMVYSSVRVENATLILEKEGCESLASMGVQAAVGGSTGEKTTCQLANITIQSTLEPAMQIACWRGILPPRTGTRREHGAEPVERARRVDPGSFTISTRHVRAIWKHGPYTDPLSLVCTNDSERSSPAISQKTSGKGERLA